MCLSNFIILWLLLPSISCQVQHCKVTNVAVNGSASQSGDHENAHLVIDGDTRPGFIENHVAQCVFTNENQRGYPWWQVDLTIPTFKVSEVIIYTNVNLQTEFVVGVGNSPIANGHVFDSLPLDRMNLCTTVRKVFLKPRRTEIKCNDLPGSFVTVIGTSKRKKKPANPLILCEVEIYGKSEFNVAYNKPTEQSSVKYIGESGLAVDGNITSQFKSHYLENVHSKCAVTSDIDYYPWWRVDLIDEFIINQVNIYTKKDTEKQLHDFEIRIGLQDIFRMHAEDKIFHENPLCVSVIDQYLIPGFNKLYCSQPMFGRYVSLQIIKKCEIHDCVRTNNHQRNMLTLCEVEVIGSIIFRRNNPKTNLQIKKPIWNIHDSNDLTLISAFKNHPWYSIELTSNSIVDHIIITTNQLVPNESFLPDFEIRVGSSLLTSNGTTNDSSSTILCLRLKNFKLSPINSYRLNCLHPIFGQKVVINVIEQCTDFDCVGKLLNTQHLNSIEVWGYELKNFIPKLNVAAFKPTTQSSIGHSGYSSLAVSRWLPDMNVYNDKCSETEMKKYPWWRVDLQSAKFIAYVIVHFPNIGILEKNIIQIRIGEHDIAEQAIDKIFTKNSQCFASIDFLTVGNVVGCYAYFIGRFVSVQLQNDVHPIMYKSLQLCEVEVFSCDEHYASYN